LAAAAALDAAAHAGSVMLLPAGTRVKGEVASSTGSSITSKLDSWASQAAAWIAPCSCCNSPGNVCTTAAGAPPALSRKLAADAGRVLPPAADARLPVLASAVGELLGGCIHTTTRSGTPADTTADSPAAVLGRPSHQ
jgi:hypothetical protein